MTKASPGPDHPCPNQTGTVRRLLRKLLPWLVLVVLFLILFSRVPLEQVISELATLTLYQVIALCLVAVFFILGVSLIDGIAMGYGFSVFGVRIPWKEIILVRAAMMVLASITSLFGQAGLAALIARKYKVPAGSAVGMVMFLFLVEVYGMVALAGLAFPVLLMVRGAEAVSMVQVKVAAVIILAAFSALPFLILIGRRAGETSIIRFRLAALLHPFRAIRPAQFIVLLLVKTLLAAWQMVVTVVFFWIYQIHVPGPELFTFMPLSILISSIPITPARLGTTQWAWVLFFGYLVPPATLVAFSLLLQFLLNVVRWLIGAMALPFISRDWGRKPPQPGSEPGQG